MAAASLGVGKVSRRDFLKLMAAAGTIMTFTPFVDWGKFLPNVRSSEAQKAKVEMPDGSQANINSFSVNHSEYISTQRLAILCSTRKRSEPGS